MHECNIKRKKGKVSFFMPTLERGGAEGVIVQVANQLSRLGYNVDIVVCNEHGSLMSEIDDLVGVKPLGVPRVAFSPISLASYILRDNPDTIVSTLVHCNVVSSWVAKYVASDTAVVLREANTISKTKESAQTLSEWTVNALVPSAYASADSIIAVSESAASDLTKCLSVEEDRIHTVYNPVNIGRIEEKSDRTADHKWLCKDDVEVLISVGRLSKQKDYKTLLDAFRKMRNRSNVKLLVLGEGPQRGKLESYARSIGVGDNVDFYGFVENPYPYMKHSDVFVLSSAWEGMPNAMIEAFVLGLPIVATDCPSGPSEILENGRWGNLAEVGDSDELCSCIDQALDIEDDDEKRRQERPIHRFDVRSVAKEYESVISNLI